MQPTPFGFPHFGVFILRSQDYHRFHFPVTGTLTSIRDVPGKLYTVNPIAVNASFPNVFTVSRGTATSGFAMRRCVHLVVDDARKPSLCLAATLQI